MKSLLTALVALVLIGFGVYLFDRASGGLKLEGPKTQGGVEWLAANRGHALSIGPDGTIKQERNGSIAFAAVLRNESGFRTNKTADFAAHLETAGGDTLPLMVTTWDDKPNVAGVTLPANHPTKAPLVAFVVSNAKGEIARWKISGLGKPGEIDVNELPVIDDVVVHDLRLRAAASTGMLFIRPEGQLPAGTSLAIQVGTTAGKAASPPNTMTPTKRIELDQATFVHGYSREDNDTKVRVEGRLVWFRPQEYQQTISDLKLVPGDGKKMGARSAKPIVFSLPGGRQVELRIVHVVFGEMVGGRKGHFVQFERVSDKPMDPEEFQFLSGRRPGQNVPKALALLQEPYHMMVEVEGDKTVGPDAVVFFPGDLAWNVGDALPPLTIRYVEREDLRVRPLDLVVQLGPDTDLDAMDAYVLSKIGKTPPSPADPMGTLGRNRGVRNQ